LCTGKGGKEHCHPGVGRFSGGGWSLKRELKGVGDSPESLYNDCMARRLQVIRELHASAASTA